MNRDNSLYLINTFPQLFPPDKTIQEALPLYFGFECGNGWFEIIKKLCEGIQKEIEEQKLDPAPYVQQVKEKFGGLRFYMSYYTDKMSKLIRKAEEEAWKTCETCGSKKDVLHTDGWIETICSKCLEERKNNV